MTTSDIDGRRLNRDINGINADVLVTEARIHAWNRSRRGGLNPQQVESKAERMASAALQKAGAKQNEHWAVTIAGDDISGQVSAERLQ